MPAAVAAPTAKAIVGSHAAAAPIATAAVIATPTRASLDGRGLLVRFATVMVDRSLSSDWSSAADTWPGVRRTSFWPLASRAA